MRTIDIWTTGSARRVFGLTATSTITAYSTVYVPPSGKITVNVGFHPYKIGNTTYPPLHPPRISASGTLTITDGATFTGFEAEKTNALYGKDANATDGNIGTYKNGSSVNITAATSEGAAIPIYTSLDLGEALTILRNSAQYTSATGLIGGTNAAANIYAKLQYSANGTDWFNTGISGRIGYGDSMGGGWTSYIIAANGTATNFSARYFRLVAWWIHISGTVTSVYVTARVYEAIAWK